MNFSLQLHKLIPAQNFWYADLPVGMMTQRSLVWPFSFLLLILYLCRTNKQNTFCQFLKNNISHLTQAWGIQDRESTSVQIVFFAAQSSHFIVSVVTKLKVSNHNLTVAKLKKKSSIQSWWGTWASDQQNYLVHSTYPCSVFVAVELLG